MIEKITNKKANDVLEILKKEPAFNLFAIGDIEVYGCESETVEVWAQIESNEIAGILLRYLNAFIPYYIDENNCDVEEFVEIIKNHPVKAGILSGKDAVIEKIHEYFDYKQYKKLFFCELNKNISKEEADAGDVEIAKPDDAEMICDLQNDIDEFTSTVVIDRVRDNIKNGFSRVYSIKNEQGKIISMAQTSAENSTAAMIVGVCTHVNYRRRGYMRRVMTKLCYDLQQENKLTCLFYDNKDAGRIYHSIGFETIGMWHMLVLN